MNIHLFLGESKHQNYMKELTFDYASYSKLDKHKDKANNWVDLLYMQLLYQF